MKIKKILKQILVIVLAELIYFELKFRNKKYIYPPFNSFGDLVEFYLVYYKKIISSKKKLLIFSNVDQRISNFFFKEKKIQKSFFP